MRGQETGGEYYYRLATGWVWHGDFDSAWDQWVWSRHAEGYSERQIVKELQQEDVPFEPCSRFPIHNTIVRVKDQMLSSAWAQNFNLDGYLSMYDTNTLVYGEHDE